MHSKKEKTISGVTINQNSFRPLHYHHKNRPPGETAIIPRKLQSQRENRKLISRKTNKQNRFRPFNYHYKKRKCGDVGRTPRNL